MNSDISTHLQIPNTPQGSALGKFRRWHSSVFSTANYRSHTLVPKPTEFGDIEDAGQLSFLGALYAEARTASDKYIAALGEALHDQAIAPKLRKPISGGVR